MDETIAGQTMLTLDTPVYGTLDRHDNGYVGCILRVWSTMKVEERTIIGYNSGTGVVTVTPALATGSADRYYEIAPAIYRGLDNVVGLYVATLISGIEGHPVRSARVEKIYVRTLRNVRLGEFYSVLQNSGAMSGKGVDYTRYRLLGR
jgi:hypothetical protein